MCNKTKNIRALICGILGCLCYGGGDWLIASCMPERAFRLGFTNGLMSESMIIWFVLILTGTGSKEYKTGGVQK